MSTHATIVAMLVAVFATSGRATEELRYLTVRRDDRARTPQEEVVMRSVSSSNTITTSYTSIHAGGEEQIVIEMASDGKLSEAWQRELDTRGNLRSTTRIRVDGESVQTRKTHASGRVSVRQRDACEDEVVADAGLLQYLRLFPFDAPEPRDVLIASFSQHFVTMHIALDGRETVTVPAGSFECYRLAGTIDLFVKEIRTVYWVTVDPPHFLVRFEGKRGLFLAPTFVTELTQVTVGDLSDPALPDAAPRQDAAEKPDSP